MITVKDLARMTPEERGKKIFEMMLNRDYLTYFGLAESREELEQYVISPLIPKEPYIKAEEVLAKMDNR